MNLMNEFEHNNFGEHHIDHGSNYYKMGWHAIKGRTRGIIRGLVMGVALGAMIGTGLWALGAVGVVSLGLAAGVGAAQVIAGTSVFAGFLGANLMGKLGSAAGNAAALHAEAELQERYPELPEVLLDTPEPGYGHHYEIPADRDKGKFFHFRVGAAGALLGAGMGALTGVAGLTSVMAAHIGGLVVAPYLAPIAIGAIFGSTFGVSRSLFKSVFNITDQLMQGKFSGPTQAELEKSRERYRLKGEDGPEPVISNLQRQEEFYRLQNGYFEKGFDAGFAGNGRGLVGGLVSGGLLGTVLGGVAVVALSSTGIGAGLIFAGVLATTMHLSSDYFSEAFFEASGHEHIHEIYHERMRAMRKGINLGFDEAEQKITERRRSDPELTPPDAQSKAAFKPRVALILGGIGALVGLGLAPLGNGLAGLLAGTAKAHLTPALGAATFGLAGVTFGLGPKVTDAISKFADKIYHGTYNPGDNHPDIKVEGKIPLMSHRSELAEHFSKHLQGNMPHITHNSGQALPQETSAAAQIAQEGVQEEHCSEASPSIRHIVERGARSLTQHAEQASVVEGVQR